MSSSTGIRTATDTDLLLQEVQAGQKQNSGGKTEKIRKYAQEFEANFLSKFYQEMQHSLGDIEGESDPGASTLTDLGVHALAMGVSAAGGVGIANLLIQHLISKEGLASTAATEK
jgi:Rod binding domain-containing protein